LERKIAVFLIAVLAAGTVVGLMILQPYFYGTPHDLIAIDGNGAFQSNGWTGNGTIDSPYIIAGLSIFSSGTCIRICNTDAYFEIRNCYLSGRRGIQLHNAAHGRIIDNQMVATEYGISAMCSPDCRIINNTVSGVSMRGINIIAESSHVIEGNTVLDCTGPGIGIDGADSFVCQRNTIRNCGTGLDLIGVTGSSVSQNTIEWCSDIGLAVTGGESINIRANYFNYNGVGIVLHICDSVTIINNTVAHNTGVGIEVEGWSMEEPSRSCRIAENNVHSNGGSGIVLNKTREAEVIDNYIHDNGAWGVYVMDDAGPSSIEGNTFEGNAEGTVGYEP